MPRLTAELIGESPQFTNPVRDWELDLRGRFRHGSGMCIYGCDYGRLDQTVEGQFASQSPSLLEESNCSCIHGLPAVLAGY